MRRRVIRRPLIAACAVLLLAGCGSTVQQLSGPAANTGQGLSVPTTGPSGVPLPGTSTGPGGTVPAGSNPGSNPGSVPAGSVPTTGGGGSDPATVHTVNGVPQGIGVTSNKIYVGITYETNGDKLNAAFGATGISQGDPKGDAKAVVADINAHGGIAGRKLVPVWWELNAESTDTYADLDEQQCQRFTQDNHVFATTNAGITDNFIACMSHAGAMLINSGQILRPDQTLLNQFPYYFEAGTLTTDRLFQQLPRSFTSLNYWSGWDPNLGRASSTTPTKIGILTLDQPEWSRPLKSVLLPELKAEGHKVAPSDVIAVPVPQSTSQESSVLNAISSAELRFRQDGVNHVILLDAAGDLLIFFSRAAQGQHYFPRYGLSTASGMQTVESGHDVDPSQLNGAVGFSWDPNLDLVPSAAAKYEPARTKACLTMIDKRTGQSLASEPNAAGIAVSYCDTLYLLKYAIEHAGVSITRDTVSAALQRLGYSYPSAGFLQEFYGPARHDGVEVGWNMKWDGSCSCTKYVGSDFRIPSL
jgi:hypothetical protein